MNLRFEAQEFVVMSSDKHYPVYDHKEIRQEI